jgi:hypothetical protein
MGYNFPVQLTQWALASAPNHPILRTFIRNFEARVKEVSRPLLKLTGPEAITVAAKEWLGREAGLRWDSLSGLDDGGKSKAVGDTIIFPITAFRYLSSLPPPFFFSLLFLLLSSISKPQNPKY